tara:strand:- start:5010 stop:5189 length:180 start_codon:yes stop_codon:yes gene_type:complete
MTQPTQKQMFYNAHRKIAEANEQFLEFVKEGLTKAELIKLIARRPELWGRFKNWIPKLP